MCVCERVSSSMLAILAGVMARSIFFKFEERPYISTIHFLLLLFVAIIPPSYDSLLLNWIRNFIFPAAQCQRILHPPAKTSMSCSQQGQRHSCILRCHGNAHFISTETDTYEVTCGQDTNFKWTHELNNATLPACSGG